MSTEETARWVAAINLGSIDLEDVQKWEFEGRIYAIIRSPEDEYYATDDICTHEHAHLSEGYVEDGCIECPRHAGRFDYKTGEALAAPVYKDLKTFPTRIKDGKVEIKIS